MSAPYTIRFYMGQVAGNSTFLVSAVPAGVVWILRDCSITSHGGTSGTLKLGLTGNPSQPIILTVPANGNTAQWKGRIVFLPGEQIALQTTTATAIDVSLNGYQLQGT